MDEKSKGGEPVMETVLSIFLILFLFFAGLFWIPALMTKNAINQVIRRFCRRNALRRRDALTREELGLNPPTFAERMTKPRDYKPYALKILKDIDVIQVTEEGKMYMDQGKLQPDYRCDREDRFSP
jgi:hypothetical protein